MAELELQAVLTQQFALTLVPGLLRTNGYARALLHDHLPAAPVTVIDLTGPSS